MDFVPIWYYDRHWSKFFISTISTHDCDLDLTLRSRSQTYNLNVNVFMSASTNVNVFVKVFKTSLFPNLITDLIHLWYDDTYWSKILRYTIPTTLGHVKVKVTDLEFKC